MDQHGEKYLSDILEQLTKLKGMGDKAMAQIDAERFRWKQDPESNSVALIVKHMAGNMRSRWVDFLTTDGEKPDRNRDSEFEDETDDSRERLLERWEEGWKLTIAAIGSLTADDLGRDVYVRRERHSVLQAINRQVVHYSVHVGQIVFLAKHLAGADWKTLSIPRGGSRKFEVNKEGKVYKQENRT